MGGGFRVGKTGGTSDRDDTGMAARAASGRDPNSTIGIARPAVGTLEDQIASGPGKWTEKRLKASFDAINREPNIFHAIRFAVKLTDQLGPGDFPLALDVIHDAKEDSDENGGEIIKMLAQARWVELNPAAAGAYLRDVDRLGDDFSGPSNVEAVVCVWAATNPKEAIAWAKSPKPSTTRCAGATRKEMRACWPGLAKLTESRPPPGARRKRSGQRPPMGRGTDG